MFAMVPVNQLALGTLPPAMIKNASGLYNTLVIDRSAAHRLHLSEATNWARPGVGSTIDAISGVLSSRLGEAADQAALARVSGLITQQALILADNDVLVVIAGLLALAVPLALFIKAPKPGGGGAAH